jgi:hypothetical protein
VPASDMGVQWETVSGRVNSKYKMQKHRDTFTFKTYTYRIITQDPGVKWLVATGRTLEEIEALWVDLNKD